MKLGMFAAAVIALAPMAHAQDLCIELKDVIAEATSGFDALKDEENFEDNYEPYFYLGDAYNCSIDTSGAAEFGCWWQFDAPAQANAKLDEMAAVVTPCLAGWTRMDIAGERSAKAIKIARGFRFDGTGANGTVFVELFTEPPKERGSPSVSLNVSVE